MFESITNRQPGIGYVGQRSNEKRPTSKQSQSTFGFVLYDNAGENEEKEMQRNSMERGKEQLEAYVA